MERFQFHPVISQWFKEKFGSPTEPQERGWPAIQSGAHTLIAAPTAVGFDRVAWNDQGLIVDERHHAAFAQRYADDFVLGPQRPRRFNEARIIVGVAKLGLRQQAEFAFIEDENIDEIE